MLVKKKRVKTHIAIIITAVTAIILVLLSLLLFTFRVNRYVEIEMQTLSSNNHRNSVQIVDNELTYLTQVTQSVAGLLEKSDIKGDSGILKALTDYANNSGIVRTLFVTVDGHVYTNYAGYLGQDQKNTFLDEIPLLNITSVYISKPHFDESLKEVIFGIVAPTNFGGKQGVLVSSYNIRHLTDLLDDSGSPCDTGIVAFDGSIIVGRSSAEYGNNIFDYLSKTTFSKNSLEQMKLDFNQLKVGSVSYNVNGLSRNCVYSPTEKNNWMVVSTIKESVLEAKTAQIKLYGTRLTAMLVFIMLCLMLVITTIILKQQKKIQEMLTKTARTDGLTGVYNRLACEEIVTNMLEEKDHPQNYAILIIDLDDFKSINDSKGHTVGDEVLKKCAQLLTEVFNDVVGRIGGDEFIVFVRRYHSKEEIEEKAKAFLDKFYVEVDGEKQKISASIGISWGDNMHSFKDLYKNADSAMYAAKKDGKGRYFSE